MMKFLLASLLMAVAFGVEEIDQFRHYEPCQSNSVNEFYNTRSASTGMTHSMGEAADKCNALRRGIDSGANINLLRCPCYETVSAADADKYLRCKVKASDPEGAWDTWARCQHVRAKNTCLKERVGGVLRWVRRFGEGVGDVGRRVHHGLRRVRSSKTLEKLMGN